MKKLAALTLSLFLISGTALADSPKDADPQPAKSAQPAKPKAAKKAEKTDANFAAELEGVGALEPRQRGRGLIGVVNVNGGQAVKVESGIDTAAVDAR